MKRLWLFVVLAAVLAAYLCVQSSVSADMSREGASSDTSYRLVQAGDSSASGPSGLEMPEGMLTEGINAVVYPFRSATVGTEVRGVLDFINKKEGDPVNEREVIAEVSRARYEAIVGEFRGNYEAVCRTLDRAREELALQEETYSKRATTYDDLLKARAQVNILESRKYEAEHKLKQAELNLKACIISAPFSGSVSVLYHEPYEMVDNLEKIFGIIDTTKVYVRANWPESRLPELAIGKKATFTYAGQRFEGEVEKISSLIDPASRTKRVHIVISNGEGKLQVGMAGSVKLTDIKKVSSLAP